MQIQMQIPSLRDKAPIDIQFTGKQVCVVNGSNHMRPVLAVSILRKSLMEGFAQPFANTYAVFLRINDCLKVMHTTCGSYSYLRAALSAWSCSNSRSIAPKRSHRRDLAVSGKEVPELGEGQLPPDPALADPAPFFESFFFFDDISVFLRSPP